MPMLKVGGLTTALTRRAPAPQETGDVEERRHIHRQANARCSLLTAPEYELSFTAAF